MRPSATTQLTYTRLNFLLPQKRVALSLLHFGDWAKTMLESNQTTWLTMEDWQSPASQPGAKGHPDVNQVPKAGLAAAGTAEAVAIQSVHHPSIPHISTILPPQLWELLIQTNLAEFEWFW